MVLFENMLISWEVMKYVGLIFSGYYVGAGMINEMNAQWEEKFGDCVGALAG